jgi:hypothetical protein
VNVVVWQAPPGAAGERPAAPPGAIGWTRRSLIFSKNGPCEVYSGCHSPGVACTAAVIPSRSSSARSGS